MNAPDAIDENIRNIAEYPGRTDQKLEHQESLQSRVAGHSSSHFALSISWRMRQCAPRGMAILVHCFILSLFAATSASTTNLQHFPFERRSN
jgi:hypothetical protein